jgi:hypothetical protein
MAEKIQYLSLIPTEIVIHHAAEFDAPTLQWAGIRLFHKSWAVDGIIVTQQEYGRRLGAHEGKKFKPPWIDIGYHAGIELLEHGYEILMGRPWDAQGAHCLKHNTRALGLCFVGDFNLRTPSTAELETGAVIVAYWMRTTGIPLGKIYRHDTLNETDCPGRLFNLTAFLNLVQEAL